MNTIPRQTITLPRQLFTCALVHLGFANVRQFLNRDYSFFDKVNQQNIRLPDQESRIAKWTRQLYREPQIQRGFNLNSGLGLREVDLVLLSRCISRAYAVAHQERSIMLDEDVIPSLLCLNQLGIRTLESCAGIDGRSREKVAEVTGIILYPHGETFDNKNTYSVTHVKLMSDQCVAYVDVAVTREIQEQLYNLAIETRRTYPDISVHFKDYRSYPSKRNYAQGFHPVGELKISSVNGAYRLNEYTRELCSKLSLN